MQSRERAKEDVLGNAQIATKVFASDTMSGESTSLKPSNFKPL
jgi:hypothetical protein